MSGLRAWLVPVAVLVVALSAAFLIERLYESAHQRHEAQVLLAQIEEEVNEQQLGKYAAINEQEVTPEIAEQISSSHRNIACSQDGLADLNFGNAESTRIRELLSAGEVAT